MQVALYAGAPREGTPPEERHAAAMACIAEGVTGQKPALIAAAQRHLLEYRAATAGDRCAGRCKQRACLCDSAVCAVGHPSSGEHKHAAPSHRTPLKGDHGCCLLSLWACRVDVGREAQEVGMELAVCALLLGRTEAALAELGLCEGAQGEPDPGVRDFVLVRLPLITPKSSSPPPFIL